MKLRGNRVGVDSVNVKVPNMAAVYSGFCFGNPVGR